MEKTSKCNSCQVKVTSRYKLDANIEPQHKGSRYGKNKNVKCEMCGYKCSTRQHLINHMRTHTSERPIKCTVVDCGKAFKLEKTLSDHIKYKHSYARAFKFGFPGCTHAAKTSASLSNHKQVHSYERPFPCPNAACNYRAKRRGTLTVHVEMVHNPAKAFACSKCDYKTAQNSDLKRHILRHSARKDFKCCHPQCPMSFKTSSEHTCHFGNRHGERNILCDHPGCGRKYASFKVLQGHKRAVHSKKSHASRNINCSFHENTASASAALMIVQEERNDKILCLMNQKGLADLLGFSCMLCDFVGYSYGAALGHAKRHHDQQPVVVSHQIPETASICLNWCL